MLGYKGHVLLYFWMCLTSPVISAMLMRIGTHLLCNS